MGVLAWSKKSWTVGIVHFFLITSLLLTLFWVVYYCQYGFDFSDEGSYIAWIADPFRYKGSVTQFGYIYNPLYRLMNSSIFHLRVANIAITFILTWIMVCVYASVVFSDSAKSKYEKYLTPAAMAIAMLAFLNWWLPTPSYNSLAMQGVIIMATGLLVLDVRDERLHILGWLAMGIGGWIVFMAKPSSAAAMGFLFLANLSFSRKLNVRGVGSGLLVATSMLAISSLYIDGSVITFIERLRSEYFFQQAFLSGDKTYTIFRINRPQLGGSLLIWFVLWVVFIIYFCLSVAKGQIGSLLSLLGYSALLLIALFPPYTVMFAPPLAMPKDNILFLSIPVGILVAVIRISMKEKKFALDFSKLNFALIVTLAAIPHAFAFGTSVNYWTAGAKVGLFWVLSGLAFIPIFDLKKAHVARIFGSAALVSILLTVQLVGSGLHDPYRQPHPLWENRFVTQVGHSGSVLILGEGFSKYITTAVKLAKQSDFVDGTPVIDLTGQSPGLLFTMGSKILGRPWIPGGYEGSDTLASLVLGQENCLDLAQAWVLFEPEGPRRLSSGVLSTYGADIDSDFLQVAKFLTPVGAGGYEFAREQYLFKPIRSNAIAYDSCLRSRE